MEKPHIIYSMPRAKSTAATNASIKERKLYEPFDYHFNTVDKDKILERYKFLAETSNFVFKNKWPNILNDLNHKNSISKFFGISLYCFRPARLWFKQADEQQTHIIFVLVRKLEEILWSRLLAEQFGFSKSFEKQPSNIKIPDVYFRLLFNDVDSFLRFFPKNAVLTTFETLPEDYFDYSRIQLEKQNSLEKISCIENRDFVEHHIREILECFKDEWNEKLLSIPRAPKLDQHILENLFIR